MDKILRLIKATEFDEYSAIVCDPSTGEYDEEYPLTRESAWNAFNTTVASYKAGVFKIEGEWQELAITDDIGKLVGIASFKVAGLEGCRIKRARIGLHIAKEHRGKGLAKKALRSLTGLLVEKAGVNMLEAHVEPENKASMAVFRSYGFYEVGKAGTSTWLVMDKGVI